MELNDIAVELRDKADISLTGTNSPHIILTFNYGHSWCRLYSDGYCIQGGDLGGNVADYLHRSFSFLIPFKNTNYVVMFHSGYTGDLYYPSIQEKTKSKVRISYTYNNPSNGNWIAFGYTNGESYGR